MAAEIIGFMPPQQSTPMLLDTSVFSLFLKQNDTRAHFYLPLIQGHILAVSFITIGELYRWVYERGWGLRRVQELESRLKRVLILPWHDSVARHWAHIRKDNPGRVLSDNDTWIAACAMTYDCTLVTSDKDFLGIHGLNIISEYKQ